MHALFSLGFLNKRPSDTQNLLSILIFLFGLAIITSTIVAVLYYHHTLPFWETIWVPAEIIPRFFAGKYQFKDLFTQYAENILVVPKLFLLIEYIFFQGTNVFLISSIFSVQFLHLIILMILYQRTVKDLKSLVIPASLGGAMLFSFLQSNNFYAGFQILFVGVYAAASCAFLCYAIGLERTAKGQSPVFPFIGMMLSMIVATLTMANGLLVGVVLLAISILQRQPLRTNLFIGSVAAAVIFSYMHICNTIAVTHPISHVFYNLHTYILYFFGFLGNPLVIFGRTMMRILGIIGVVSVSYSCWLIWTRKITKPSQVSLVGISIFIILTALAITRGRCGFSQEIDSRYITPSLIFWATQVFFWMSLTFVGLKERIRKLTLVIVSSFICTSIMIVQIEQLNLHKRFSIFKKRPINPNFRKTGLERHIKLNLAADSLISDVHDPSAFLSISPGRPEFGLEFINFLKTHHFSIFADPVSHWVGQKLSDVLLVVPNSGTCQGEITSFSPIVGSSTPDGAQISGWAWNNTERAGIQRILLVNQEDVIIGVGSGNLKIPNFSTNILKSGNSLFVGWQGYTKIPANGIIKVFGVIDNRTTACPCGKFSWINSRTKITNLEKRVDEQKI